MSLSQNTTNNSSSTTYTIDRDKYLHQLNAKFTANILPAVLVLSILMTLGILGNSIVLYVYSRRMKTGTITRYIQALAIFDLLSCSLAIPGEIIDMTNNYTFGSNPLCQIVRTVNIFCTMASGSILIVVAIDRYKRICYPLRKQISPRCALHIMVVCSCLAFVFSLPTAIIFGANTVATNISYINGTDCSVNDRYVHTIIPLLYNGSQMLLFIVGAIILIVVYSIIARRIFQHAQGRQRRRSGGSQCRRRRKIWSISYCSSPSISPMLDHDEPTMQCSPNLCSELKDNNCDGANVNFFNNEFQKIECDTILLSDTSNQAMANSHCTNSDCKFKFANKKNFSLATHSASYENVSLDYNTTSVHIDDRSIRNYEKVNGNDLFGMRCLKTRSLPKLNTLSMGDNRDMDDNDLLPPSTPIEELDNQTRWLLKSSSEAESTHNESLTKEINPDKARQEYECKQLQLKQPKISKQKKSFKSEKTSNDTSRPDQEISLPNRRWSMRLSFKGLGDFKKLSMSSDSAGTRRTTLMLFVITLVFILSFLPHQLLMIFKSQSINWLSQFNETGQMFHNLLIRSYFINSASNPIIYSFFSKNFFSECKHMIKSICKK